MDILLSCKFNIDTACVELRYADGEILSIDCIAVEDEFGYSPHARVELDWLIYNDPLSYTQMVLGGNRQISRRIKRPPSQRISNEMAVSIFIMV